jgi:hypothetical protein
MLTPHRLTRCGGNPSSAVARGHSLVRSPGVALAFGYACQSFPQAATWQGRVPLPSGTTNWCIKQMCITPGAVLSLPHKNLLSGWPRDSHRNLRSVQFLRHAVSSLSLTALSPFGRRNWKWSPKDQHAKNIILLPLEAMPSSFAKNQVEPCNETGRIRRRVRPLRLFIVELAISSHSPTCAGS